MAIAPAEKTADVSAAEGSRYPTYDPLVRMEASFRGDGVADAEVSGELSTVVSPAPNEGHCVVLETTCQGGELFYDNFGSHEGCDVDSDEDNGASNDGPHGRSFVTTEEARRSTHAEVIELQTDEATLLNSREMVELARRQEERQIYEEMLKKSKALEDELARRDAEQAVLLARYDEEQAELRKLNGVLRKELKNSKDVARHSTEALAEVCDEYKKLRLANALEQARREKNVVVSGDLWCRQRLWIFYSLEPCCLQQYTGQGCKIEDVKEEKGIGK